jgi:hypothetical protein
MTVAELCGKLQDVAHSGDAQKEIKNVVDIQVTQDGVYFLLKSLEEDIAENPPGLWQC